MESHRNRIGRSINNERDQEREIPSAATFGKVFFGWCAVLWISYNNAEGILRGSARGFCLLANGHGGRQIIDTTMAVSRILNRLPATSAHTEFRKNAWNAKHIFQIRGIRSAYFGINILRHHILARGEQFSVDSAGSNCGIRLTSR
jgi:hypothetical protein